MKTSVIKYNISQDWQKLEQLLLEGNCIVCFEYYRIKGVYDKTKVKVCTGNGYRNNIFKFGDETVFPYSEGDTALIDWCEQNLHGFIDINQ